LLDSLSSAGNVCWAKPNHGFFRCQHFVAIIFNRFSVRAGCRRALETDKNGIRNLFCEFVTRRVFHQTAFFQCFYSIMSALHESAATLTGLLALHARAVDRPRQR
jgi:hypothetical protein